MAHIKASNFIGLAKAFPNIIRLEKFENYMMKLKNFEVFEFDEALFGMKTEKYWHEIKKF